MSPGASPEPPDFLKAVVSPLFDAVRPWLGRLPADRPPTLEELNALGAAVRFVAPTDSTDPYEIQIERSGEVPTRPGNWHDVFNALAWMTFPRTKAVLNRRHAEQIRLRGAAGPRGTARDVLSLFDEGGVIVTSVDPSLLELLRTFEWQTLFWQRRGDVVHAMRFYVFGHAILEKALEPYKAVTAKALLLDVPADFLDRSHQEQLEEADSRSAEWFARSALDSTRSLSPLPVLGIPGWADNEHAAYYKDETVFRRGYSRAGA